LLFQLLVAIVFHAHSSITIHNHNSVFLSTEVRKTPGGLRLRHIKGEIKP